MALCERRMSCSTDVLKIWEAMVAIRVHKQGSNFQRIAAYAKKMFNMSEETVDQQLLLMVIDNLVKKNKKTAAKESFTVPGKDFEKGTHDWYCFECHTSGKVMCCSSCHRVYHPSCVQGRNLKEEAFVCPICKMLNSDKNLKLDANEINEILVITCRRLKEMRSHDYKIEKNDEDAWKLSYLLYDYLDLVTMEAKATEGKYRQLEEFYADALLIAHNAVIFYDASTQKDNLILAKQLVEDCKSNLDEIRNCPNCFRLSNDKEKSVKSWFCLPCNPPHELVYAKQSGYPYWPAKVINKTDGSYNVRFFGASHQRAIVPKNQVKPISCDTAALGIKRSSSWKKACDQLAYHQKLLSESGIPGETKAEDKAIDIKQDLNSPPVKRIKVEKPKNDSPTIPATPENDDVEMPAAIVLPAASDPEIPEEHCMSSSSQLEDENKNLPSADSHNVVSSTQDSIIEGFVTSATQTQKALNIDAKPCKLVQTDFEKEVDDKLTRSQVAAEIKVVKEKAVRLNTIKLEKKHSEDKEKAVANVRKELTECQEEHQRELEKCLEDYQRELKAIHANYQKQLTEAKKKQWCYNCEREAVYHCCWNTSYCSVDCQQIHWQKEHKRNCRRKRNTSQHNQPN